jgi:uncharacterized DUF497 family protein
VHWVEPLWDDANIEKLSRRATAEEVEAVIFDPSSLIIRARGGEDPDYRRYACLGVTDEGRYLTVFLDYLGRGLVRPVSVREMDDAERSRFKSGGK